MSWREEGLPSPGAVGNPNWQPGVSGNPTGRTRTTAPGKTTQKRIKESLTALAEHVAQAPATPRSAVQILQDFANDPKISTSLRISAASAVAPYEQSKFLSVPGPVYLHSQIDVPIFDTLEAAESFLLSLSQREAAGELETASVQTVTERVRLWIQSKRNGQELELKKITAGHDVSETTIRIEGGLPPLPGTNVTMPQLNGHNGYDPNGLLPQQPQQIESSQVIDASQVPGPSPGDPTASATGHMPAIESVPDQPCSVMALAPQPAPVAPPATHTHHGPPQCAYGAHTSFHNNSGEPAQGPERPPEGPEP
jgi:hypothetical protein